jgi:hypothetical protein
MVSQTKGVYCLIGITAATRGLLKHTMIAIDSMAKALGMEGRKLHLSQLMVFRWSMVMH